MNFPGKTGEELFALRARLIEADYEGRQRGDREMNEKKKNPLADLRAKYEKDEKALKLVDNFTARFSKDGDIPAEHMPLLNDMLELHAASEASRLKAEKELEEKLQLASADFEKKLKEKEDEQKGAVAKLENEFKMQRETLESLVKDASAKEREAKLQILVKALYEAKHAPTSVQFFEQVARQEAAASPTIDLERDGKEEGKVETYKGSVVEVMYALLETIPFEMRMGSILEAENTQVGGKLLTEKPKSDVDKILESHKALGLQIALRNRGITDEAEVKKELAKHGVTVQERVQ